jgi:glycosyltransferase involved in cell wall biosynthesis
MRPPLVSVVVIFRDEIRFLAEAIESVFTQSNPNWELFLVDDASTDGSSALAARYAEARGERVRYLEPARDGPRGTSASRNLGVRQARGRYVAFLDGDDVWLPRKLEDQVTILEDHPEVALVYGRTEYWYSWTESPADAERDFVRPLGVEANTVVAPARLLTLALESTAPVAWPSDFMVRRSIFERVGGFEERFPGLFDDQALLAKLYLTEPEFVSDRCWFRYRRHDRSVTAVARSEKHVVGLEYLRWLDAYLTDTGMGDEDVRRALREKRARYEAELEQAPKRGARAYARVVGALGGRSRRSAASRIGSSDE